MKTPTPCSQGYVWDVPEAGVYQGLSLLGDKQSLDWIKEMLLPAPAQALTPSPSAFFPASHSPSVKWGPQSSLG